MKTFATYGHTEFALALGEGGDDIRQYFLRYSTHRRDVEVNIAQGTVQYLNHIPENNWRIKLVETGLNVQTGSRLARCRTDVPSIQGAQSELNLRQTIDMMGFIKRTIMWYLP